MYVALLCCFRLEELADHSLPPMVWITILPVSSTVYPAITAGYGSSLNRDSCPDCLEDQNADISPPLYHPMVWITILSVSSTEYPALTAGYGLLPCRSFWSFRTQKFKVVSDP